MADELLASLVKGELIPYYRNLPIPESPLISYGKGQQQYLLSTLTNKSKEETVSSSVSDFLGMIPFVRIATAGLQVVGNQTLQYLSEQSHREEQRMHREEQMWIIKELLESHREEQRMHREEQMWIIKELLEKTGEKQKDENAEIKKENAELKKENAELKKEKAELKGKVKDLEKGLEEQKKETAELRKGLEEQKKENAELKDKFEEIMKMVLKNNGGS